MEKNNFNKAYMYIVGIFAIGVAMSNVISFFNGVGFALIGASLLLFLSIANILKSEDKKRFGDIFILLAIEFIMFIVLFFAYDFNLNGLTNKFPLVIRNICAIYSILAIGYVLFRYISEIKGKKYVFVEYILGNYTPVPKQKKEKKAKLSKAEIKKNKELENGTLEPKPSSIEASTADVEPATSVESDEQPTEQSADAEEHNDEQNNEQPAKEDAENTINGTNRTGYWY